MRFVPCPCCASSHVGSASHAAHSTSVLAWPRTDEPDMADVVVLRPSPVVGGCNGGLICVICWTAELLMLMNC